MNIYQFDCYKDFLIESIKKSPSGGRGMKRKIAEFVNCHTSFVSQVLSGEKDFSLEQSLKLSKFFSLNELETKFFLNLVNFSRSGDHELKDYYEQEKQALRLEGQRMENFLEVNAKLSLEEAAKYYSDSSFSLVRLACAFKNIRTAQDISIFLGMDLEKVEKILTFLLEKKILMDGSEGLVQSSRITHLEKDSPMINLHHRNWRMKALQKQEIPDDRDLFFTVPMSLATKDIEKVKLILQKAVKEIYALLGDSEDQSIACLNIDWFRVSREMEC